MRVTLMLADFQQTLPVVVAYIGPDLLMPLTSALAAIAGVLLIFWNRVVGFVRAAWRTLFQRDSTPRG